MKRILFYILLIGVVTSGYSQIEFNNKFKAIPPVNIPPKEKKEAEKPVIEAPNVFKNPEIVKPDPKYQLNKPSDFSMMPNNEFINPGDAVKDRLNKKPTSEEGIVYRKNQNLGDFKTASLTAKVRYRDAAYVDGDEIRVYLNDKVIQSQVSLDSHFKGFEIDLIKGINKIDFEALNQGSSGPNTAEFQVYDDKGGLISASQWNLGTGFKATIILVRE